MYLDVESFFSFIFDINSDVLDGLAKGINTSLFVTARVESKRDMKTSFSLADMSIDLVTRSRRAYSCCIIC